MRDLQAVLGDRQAAVARELTKLFEEVRRDRLSALIAHYEAAGAPKGEIVIVVGPPEEERASAEDIDTLLRRALASMSVKDAAATVAAATGAPKRMVYARALELRGRRTDDAACCRLSTFDNDLPSPLAGEGREGG